MVVPYLFAIGVSVLVSTFFNIIKVVEELIPMVLSVLVQEVQLSVIYLLYTLSPASFGNTTFYDIILLCIQEGRQFRGHSSGGGVVGNTLDYQSRNRKIDPQLLRSFG